MWLDNLKELKKKTNLSSKQIAEKTNLPERTVARIFSGDTDTPRVDTLRRIVAVLGGSLDDLFAESGSVVVNTDVLTLQAEIETLKNERDTIAAENAVLKDKIVTLKDKVDTLKDEIISLHNYYIRQKTNN